MKQHKKLGLRSGKLTVTKRETVFTTEVWGTVVAFFFGAWVIMIVWGALALRFATPDWTISYFVACAVTMGILIVRRILRR